MFRETHTHVKSHSKCDVLADGASLTAIPKHIRHLICVCRYQSSSLFSRAIFDNQSKIDVAKMSTDSNSQPSVMLPRWTKEPGFPNAYPFSWTYKPPLSVVSMQGHQDLENAHKRACPTENRYSLPMHPKAVSYPTS